MPETCRETLILNKLNKNASRWFHYGNEKLVSLVIDLTKLSELHSLHTLNG
jgi:hypothetical protein